jgi:hypothetical protein
MTILASKSAFSSHWIDRESLKCQSRTEEAKITKFAHLFLGAPVRDVASVDEHVASGKMGRCIMCV